MSKINKTVAGLLVLAVGIGLVNVFLMPPFMNPDEIQHFLFSAGYAYNGEQLKQLDADVLQLLKDHKWFHFIGVGPGWEQIKDIKEIFFIHYFSRERRSVSKTYFHFFYGKLLKFSGIHNPLTALYFMRFISFLFFLGIFLFCLFFYKKYFPSYWLYMAAGQLLLFQPATILNSVNYDVLLALLGVLFFIFAYRFMDSGERRNLIFLVLLSGLAALIKTGGMLFFLYFFLLLPFKYRTTDRVIKKIPLVLLGFVVMFSWFNYWFPERFYALYTTLFAKVKGASRMASDMEGSFFDLRFLDTLVDSFFFYTGWMGFKVGSLWYVFQKLFLLVGMIAAVAGGWIKKLETTSLEKKWNMYALTVFVLQLVSVRLYYGSVSMSQGRYILPLLIPIITLLFCGLKAIEKYFHFKKNYLAVSFIALQVFFMLAALVRIISVFYLEIASPHTGL
jgi:hypothetical protein